MFFRQLPLFILAIASPAVAQRTTSNVVTASDDAFGRAVGNDKIGIYSIESVRGFNPIEAGNVRIEGLYFDQQSTPSSRLVDSSAVRVGYAAKGYPFPAPTGIADLQIEKFEGKRVISLDVEAESYRNFSGSAQLKLPLVGETLGVSAGLGARFAQVRQGRDGHYLSAGINLDWKPYSGAETVAFLSRLHISNMRTSPTFFPSGSFSPPHVNRRRFVGQPWADGKSNGITNGIYAKLPIGPFRLDAGVFRSVRDDPLSFADLALGTANDGSIGNRVIIADRNSFAASTSGEMRLTHSWGGTSVRHRIVAGVRARSQKRLFGGQQSIALGASVADAPDDRAAPVLAFGPDDRSHVRQYTFGLGYNLDVNGKGSLGLAIQKSDYRKETRFADPLLLPAESHDKPVLFSVNATVALFSGLSAYGGYVRGLEESAVAPDIASNRNEAPPALRTSQMDGGLRYAISPRLSMIVGLFEVKKPYFNVDATNRFRELGTVTNRGIEFSLAGTALPGLTVIAGALLLDPKVSGEAVAAGIIGPRPAGSVSRRGIANLDWKPVGQEAWSFDISYEGYSGATGDRLNTFTAPARNTFGLGARYRFHLGRAKLLLRGQVANLFNDYSWRVSSSGGFTFTLPRKAIINLAADF